MNTFTIEDYKKCNKHLFTVLNANLSGKDRLANFTEYAYAASVNDIYMPFVRWYKEYVNAGGNKEIIVTALKNFYAQSAEYERLYKRLIGEFNDLEICLGTVTLMNKMLFEENY